MIFWKHVFFFSQNNIFVFLLKHLPAADTMITAVCPKAHPSRSCPDEMIWHPFSNPLHLIEVNFIKTKLWQPCKCLRRSTCSSTCSLDLKWINALCNMLNHVQMTALQFGATLQSDCFRHVWSCLVKHSVLFNTAAARCFVYLSWLPQQPVQAP